MPRYDETLMILGDSTITLVPREGSITSDIEVGWSCYDQESSHTVTKEEAVRLITILQRHFSL